MCNCCWNNFNNNREDNKLNFNKFENDRNKDEHKGFYNCVLKCCCCFKDEDRHEDKCDKHDKCDKFDRCERNERCNCHESRKQECERKNLCCRFHCFWN